MSTPGEIKSAIEKLPRSERRRLVSWVMSSDEKEWDREIESDLQSGLLDDLADEAISEHSRNKTEEL